MFRGSCLATSNEKPECEKKNGFFYASVNGSIVDGLNWEDLSCSKVSDKHCSVCKGSVVNSLPETQPFFN